jgi:hypothetical protein
MSAGMTAGEHNPRQNEQDRLEN